MAPPVMNRIKGYIFAIMLFVCSTFGVLVFGGCLLPFFVIRPNIFRHLYDPMLGLWMWMVAGLLELLLGVDVKVCGDQMRANEPSIILMNHRTRLDWMYFWCALARQPSGIATEKILLKAPLKQIPGAGWAMQAGVFLFLNRRWEDDKVYLDTMLNYLCQVGYSPLLLLFPEGTDYNDETRARSDAYATKNNLPFYKNLLQPRTTGFTYMADFARRRWPNAGIYDVTISYPGTFPQNEPELVSGIFPASVHFHIKRCGSAGELPEATADLEQWLRQCWSDKDERIGKFHADGGKFVGEPVQSPPGQTEWLRIYYGLTIAFWVVFATLMSIVTVTCSAARWMLLAISLFYMFVSYRCGGFELFQARHASRNFGPVKP